MTEESAGDSTTRWGSCQRIHRTRMNADVLPETEDQPIPPLQLKIYYRAGCGALFLIPTGFRLPATCLYSASNCWTCSSIVIGGWTLARRRERSPGSSISRWMAARQTGTSGGCSDMLKMPISPGYSPRGLKRAEHLLPFIKANLSLHLHLMPF